MFFWPVSPISRFWAFSILQLVDSIASSVLFPGTTRGKLLHSSFATPLQSVPEQTGGAAAMAGEYGLQSGLASLCVFAFVGLCVPFPPPRYPCTSFRVFARLGAENEGDGMQSNHVSRQQSVYVIEIISSSREKLYLL